MARPDEPGRASGPPAVAAPGEPMLAERARELRPEAVLINEAQLLLAEKRTSLAVLRTGISVFVLPLSVLSVLVATSKNYDLLGVMPLLVPLLALCAGLVLLGVYLTHRAIAKIHRYDQAIQKLKRESRSLTDIID